MLLTPTGTRSVPKTYLTQTQGVAALSSAKVVWKQLRHGTKVALPLSMIWRNLLWLLKLGTKTRRRPGNPHRPKSWLPSCRTPTPAAALLIYLNPLASQRKLAYQPDSPHL